MSRLVAVALLLLCGGPAWARQAEEGNMRLVGRDDLQARSAYQPIIHRQRDLWSAYVVRHEGRRLNRLTGRTELTGAARDIANFAGRAN